MLPSEMFAVGTRVRYVSYVRGKEPDERGLLGTVTHAPCAANIYLRQPTTKWIGMRVQFDGTDSPVMVFPDQFEVVSVIDRLAELGSTIGRLGEAPGGALGSEPA